MSFSTSTTTTMETEELYVATPEKELVNREMHRLLCSVGGDHRAAVGRLQRLLLAIATGTAPLCWSVQHVDALEDRALAWVSVEAYNKAHAAAPWDPKFWDRQDLAARATWLKQQRADMKAAGELLDWAFAAGEAMEGGEQHRLKEIVQQMELPALAAVIPMIAVVTTHVDAIILAEGARVYREAYAREKADAPFVGAGVHKTKAREEQRAWVAAQREAVAEVWEEEEEDDESKIQQFANDTGIMGLEGVIVSLALKADNLDSMISAGGALVFKEAFARATAKAPLAKGSVRKTQARDEQRVWVAKQEDVVKKVLDEAAAALTGKKATKATATTTICATTGQGTKATEPSLPTSTPPTTIITTRKLTPAAGKRQQQQQRGQQGQTKPVSELQARVNAHKTLEAVEATLELIATGKDSSWSNEGKRRLMGKLASIIYDTAVTVLIKDGGVDAAKAEVLAKEEAQRWKDMVKARLGMMVGGVNATSTTGASVASSSISKNAEVEKTSSTTPTSSSTSSSGNNTGAISTPEALGQGTLAMGAGAGVGAVEEPVDPSVHETSLAAKAEYDRQDAALVAEAMLAFAVMEQEKEEKEKKEKAAAAALLQKQQEQEQEQKKMKAAQEKIEAKERAKEAKAAEDKLLADTIQKADAERAVLAQTGGVTATVSGKSKKGRNGKKGRGSNKGAAVQAPTAAEEPTPTAKKPHAKNGHKVQKLRGVVPSTSVKGKAAVATPTRDNKAGSAAPDMLASSASELEATHSSIQTSSTAFVAAAALASKEGEKEGEAPRPAASGAGSVFMEEDEKPLAPMPAISSTNPPALQQQQQQQQQQLEQPLETDLSGVVVEDSEQNNDLPLDALVSGNSPNPTPTPTPIEMAPAASELKLYTRVIPPVEAEHEQDEEDENEDEAPRRASPCSKLVAFASRLFKRVVCSGRAKEVNPAPACVDLDYLPAVDTMEGYSIVVIKAVEDLDQQKAAHATDSSSTPISTTTTTIPPSDFTHPQDITTGTDAAAGSSSVVALGQSEAPIDGVPSSSPCSPPPSLVSRTTAVLLLPGKCAVSVAQGTLKAGGTLMRKSFGLVKGVGSIIWRVLRAIGWGLRRVVRVLINGTRSGEEMEMMGEEEQGLEEGREEEGVVDGVGVGDGE